MTGDESTWLSREEFVERTGRLDSRARLFVRKTFFALEVPWPEGVKFRIGNARRTFWYQRYKPVIWARGGKRTIYCDRGKLNVEGGLELWTPYGMSVLCHEFDHVRQADEAGWLKWQLIKIGNVLRSIRWLGYKHDKIPIEVEATEFMVRARRYWEEHRDRLAELKP